MLKTKRNRGRKVDAGALSLTSAEAAVEVERLEAEQKRLAVEGWRMLLESFEVGARLGAKIVLRDRLAGLEATRESLIRERAEAEAAAADAGCRVAPLLAAAERVEPTAGELTHAEAEVVALEERRDELVEARRLANFEMRREEVERLRAELERLDTVLGAAVAHRRSVRERAAEGARLRAEAQGFADEQARLLEVAAAKGAERADLPRKVALQVEEAERLRATLQRTVREQPERFIDLSAPQFVRGENGLMVGPDGAVFNPKNGAFARLA